MAVRARSSRRTRTTPTPTPPSSLALLLVLIFTPMCVVHAVVPTARVAFQLHQQPRPQFAGLLGSPSFAAEWGVPLPEIQNARWKHVHMQALDALDPEGCHAYALPSFAPPHGLHSDPYKTLVVVDRGNCSFLQKTQRAMAAGANGVVIRGTKKAVYDAVMAANKTNTTAPTPTLASDPLQLAQHPVFEYDCANGEAFVASFAEPKWATDDPRCSTNAKCSSKRCVLTGRDAPSRGGAQLCCLWDTPILMGVGNRSLAQNVSVPVVYLTIADGQQLERTVAKFPAVLVRTFARDAPFLDVSSLLLWAVGVATAVGAAYYSAAHERLCFRCRTDPEYLLRWQQQQLERGRQRPSAAHDDDGDDDGASRSPTWEIDGKTAVAFIVGAAGFLTVFYYVKVAQLIPVLFAFSATTTFTQLVTAPLLHAAVPAIASRHVYLPVVNETWPLAELVGGLGSLALAVVWFVFRRSAWYLQDAFGVSLCFVFLRTVQLPNLKVATILLSLAFCYDVFFVFLSPLVFGSSVMEDVATGGPAAYTRSDYPGIDYCERYPTFEACLDPEPMPMLLVLPRFCNWLGGVSMLGLGDIILPGLLLSYALRFDYSPQSLGEKYFRSVCIGYGIGLGMANMAVTITQVGQPALMYLVPTCLGTILVQAQWTGDFKAMWLGLGMKDSGMDKRHDGDRVGANAARDPIVGGPSPRVNDAPHDQAPLLGSSSGLMSPR